MDGAEKNQLWFVLDHKLFGMTVSEPFAVPQWGPLLFTQS